MTKKLLLLHYNDIYNIQARTTDPVGGAARLAHLVKGYAEENPLIFFSGDSLSPSVMSGVTQGEHMVPTMNNIGTHVACLGNHDLDFGVDQFVEYTAQWNFPWLVANIFDADTGEILCGLQGTLLKEWNGVQVGIIGLVEEGWMATIGAIDPEDFTYRDFVECGRELAQGLIAQGAELVVAVTHMRRENDELLLQSVQEIDIVCGGHDHDYSAGYIDPHKTLLVKSGTDFRDLTKVQVEIDDDGKKTCTFERIPVTSDVPEDPEMKAIVDKYVEEMGPEMNRVIGHTAVELDGQFVSIRAKESNLGNFVCDVLRRAARAEICLINSGSFRSDTVHPRGPITKGILQAILPFVSPTVLLKLSGAQLIEALENSVSRYDECEGRFLQVSGLKFTFDHSKPVGSRIVADSVFIEERGEAVKMDETYSVSTGEYLAEGNDGYTVFQGAEVIRDSEECPVMPPIVRLYFTKVEVLNKLKSATADLSLWAKRIAARLSVELKAALTDIHNLVPLVKEHAEQLVQKSNPEKQFTPASPVVYDEELELFAIAPVVEGRITQI